MKFKPGDQRFGTALVAVLGLPEYLPGAAIVREEGHLGISSMTLLTPEQEVKLKSATNQLIGQVLRLQERNKEVLKQRRKGNEKLKRAANESVRKGETKLRPHQLEALSFIRHNSGETVKKAARLYSQGDEIKQVKFLVTVCFLEACGLVCLRKSGIDQIPELTRDGHTLLSNSKDPNASFKRPISIEDWRDLALAVIIAYQVGDDYSLGKLENDAKRHCHEFGFELSGIAADAVQNFMASGVLALQRRKDVVITKSEGKENIALSEPDLVKAPTESPKKEGREEGSPTKTSTDDTPPEENEREKPAKKTACYSISLREVNRIINDALRE